MKNFKEITIGDEICFFEIKESTLFEIYTDIEKFDRISLGYLTKDLVIDRYDFYQIELKEHGIMRLCDDDLLKDSDALGGDEDSILMIATSEEGIKNELKKMFANIEVRKKEKLY